MFILRRLSSLAAIFPLGFFLLEHLTTNSMALGPNGVANYNEAVHRIYNTPFLVVFELLLIYLPLLFHSLVGIFILSRTSTPIAQYASMGSFRYLLQRVTGIIVLSFITYHVVTIRLPILLHHQPIVFDTMMLQLASPRVLLFYLFGTLAVCYHFAHGLWSSLITWGITVSDSSQKISLRCSAVLMLVLTFVSWITIANFAFHNRKMPWGVGAILNFVNTFFGGIF